MTMVEDMFINVMFKGLEQRLNAIGIKARKNTRLGSTSFRTFMSEGKRLVEVNPKHLISTDAVYETVAICKQELEEFADTLEPLEFDNDAQ